MPQMDAILFDFSEDAQFHFGLEDSVNIANAYPRTPLILVIGVRSMRQTLQLSTETLNI